MNNEAVQYLPEIVTGVGLGIGYVVDRAARLHAQKHEDGIINDYGPIEGMPETSTISRTHRQKLGSFVLRSAGAVLVTGAAFGLAPIAFMNNEAPQSMQKPTLEEVLDLSGQTLEDGSSTKVLTINNAFIGNQKMRINVDLARAGSFQEGNITPAKVDNSNVYWPTGAVSLTQATSVSIGEANKNAVIAQSNVIGSHNNSETNAVLVVSDGNSIGSVESVVSEAKELGTEIFIANVASSDNAIVEELKHIANETGGEYWNASKDTARVAKTIVQAISPAGETIPTKTDNNWQNWLKVLDISTALAVVGLTLKTAGLVFKKKREIS